MSITDIIRFLCERYRISTVEAVEIIMLDEQIAQAEDALQLLRYLEWLEFLGGPDNVVESI